MNITPADLQAEYDAAHSAWGSAIEAAETSYTLPRLMLYAVGSVETNLRNEAGDDAPRTVNGQTVQPPMTEWGVPGWGNGIWQRDSQWHGPIPAGYKDDVAAQAAWAAGQLREHLNAFPGNVVAALCAYNAGDAAVSNALAAGRDPNSVTTGGDYGSDAYERLQYLQGHVPMPVPNPPQEEHEMDVKISHTTGRVAAAVIGTNGQVYVATTNTLADFIAGRLSWHGLPKQFRAVACDWSQDGSTLAVVAFGTGALAHNIYVGTYVVHTGAFDGWHGPLPGHVEAVDPGSYTAGDPAGEEAGQ